MTWMVANTFPYLVPLLVFAGALLGVYVVEGEWFVNTLDYCCE